MDQAFDLQSFLAKYVDTNVAAGSVKFDHDFLLENVLGGMHRANSDVFSKTGFHILVC